MFKRLLDRALLTAVKRSHTVAQRIVLSVPTWVEGQRLTIPVLTGAGLSNMRIGPDTLHLLRVGHHVLRHSRGAVIDVGCNIGQFLEVCVLFDRSRRYVGFDVSLSCSGYVERLIRDNGLKQHTVLPIGLSDAPGVARFLANAPFDVCASLSRESHPNQQFAYETAVVVERGDTVLTRLGIDEVGLIKIDVEGAEPQVLSGLRRTIARWRPYLVFEVLGYAHFDPRSENRAELEAVAAQRRHNALRMERFLFERDYVVYRVLDEAVLERRATLDPGDFAAQSSTDHLALPRECVETFLADYPYAVRGDSSPRRAA